MNARDIGVMAGRLRNGVQRIIQSNWIFMRRVLLVIGIVLAIPPVERYWLERMPRLPDIPVSVIVFTAVATLFMATTAAVLYVGGILLINMIHNVPAAGIAPLAAPAIHHRRAPPTGGTFIPASDEELYLREQFEILKKQGILTDTDNMDLETMAKELGMAAILQAKGKTE